MIEKPRKISETNDRPLAGSIAIVTGATRGLGREIAIRVGAAGANVVIVSRNKRDCDELGAFISEQYRVECLGIEFDLVNWKNADQIVEAVVAKFGKLDILINNAGTGSVEQISELHNEKIEELFSLNLFSAMSLARGVVPWLCQSDNGRIINIGSVLGIVGREYRTIYCATKGALTSLTKSLAIELAHTEVSVNCVAPGQFYTSLTEGMWDDDKKREDVTALIPKGRWGHPTELVEHILTLLTERGAYATGQTIIVDGGWSV